MPPKIKKTCYQKVSLDWAKKEKGMGEKENKCPKLEVSEGNAQEKSALKEKRAEEWNDFVSPALSPQLKPTGFWSKKLQDLEENKTKNKKFGLYEFSGTDESDTSFKIKKKPKRNARLKKKKMKKEPVMPKHKKPVEKVKREKNMKETEKPALVKEKIMLSKERKKLTDEDKSFTFSTEMPTIGITSTPAIKKRSNLIGASNFLFLSPIIKEEAEPCNSVMESSTVSVNVMDRSPLTVHLNKDSTKIKTKLLQISCRRVLRSGKALGT